MGRTSDSRSAAATDAYRNNPIWDRKVEQLDDARPHLTVDCEGGPQVVPVALVVDIIEGRTDLTELEEWRPLIRKVLKEWLAAL